MRQSTLALICGLILFVVLAYSWCGRNPPPQGNALLTTPTPTPAPSVTTAAPQATTSPSVSVAPAIATPPMQTPPPEFLKVARTAAPAIIEITVFDAKGQLLRTGNAFFVSRDGLLVTSWTIVADAAHGVAKSPDGKIRNVTGVLASDQQSDLAIVRAETKVGVPTLSLTKNSESIAVNAWAVIIGSSLQHKDQPVAAGIITSLGADPKKDAFQISGAIPNDAAGAQVIESTGQGLLDSAAVDALRRWRAEPGAHEWNVLVPVTFQP